MSVEEALRRRRGGANWTRTGRSGDWTAAADGKEGYVREVAGEYEARVYRHPTGPDGPDPVLAHGPRVFATAEEALDWCESQLGVRGAGPEP